MSIYTLIKQLIELGSYDKNELVIKLDVFFLANRITSEEYNDLRELMQ